jgi:hypothetical protein
VPELSSDDIEGIKQLAARQEITANLDWDKFLSGKDPSKPKPGFDSVDCYCLKRTHDLQKGTPLDSPMCTLSVLKGLSYSPLGEQSAKKDSDCLPVCQEISDRNPNVCAKIKMDEGGTTPPSDDPGAP